MPPQERVGLYDGEKASPLDESGEHCERDPRGVVQPARRHVPLDVERQLLAQEEILRRQPVVGARAERHQSQDITHNSEEGANPHSGR